MNKTVSSLILLLICVSTLYGCSTHKNPNNNIGAVSPINVEDFLKTKGFDIVKTNDKADSYVLSKEKLSSGSYSNIWGLQMLDVKSYIGKTVDTYGFTVKGHPLDNARDNNKHQTKVWVMVVENTVIGGYSLPDYDEVHYGGVYSIDGKTLEEVTGLSFQEWSDRWKKDYNSQKSQKTSEQISKLIDDKLNAIISNPKHMASSNPYDYTKENEDYEYIVNQGDKALEYMLSKFKKSNENGLKEYVMAIACSEILGEKPEQKNWSSGREWYENYLKDKKQENINIKGSLVDVYSMALDSFMPLDEGLNGDMKFIAIAGNTLKYLQADKRNVVLKNFEKYKVKVMDASLEELKKVGLFNEKQLYLEGVLLSVKDVTIVSDEEIVVEGSKYRSGDGAIGVKCTLKYKNGNWMVDKADITWIS